MLAWDLAWATDIEVRLVVLYDQDPIPAIPYSLFDKLSCDFEIIADLLGGGSVAILTQVPLLCRVEDCCILRWL